MEYGSASLINIKDSQMIDVSIQEQDDYSRSDFKTKKGNAYRLKMKGSPKTELTYNSLQNIKIHNPKKGKLESKNRQSLTEMKKRNIDIESKLKVMDQQRK